MRTNPLSLCRLSVAVAALLSGAAHAESYKYTGTLYAWGEPANGAHDLRVSAYDAATKGRLVLPATTFPAVDVKNGTFEVELDVGDALSTHESLWIQTEIGAPGGELVVLQKRDLATAKAANACWGTAGNTGTDPAFDFLGTTDGQPFAIRVNNSLVARFSNDSADGRSPNVVMGGSANSALDGIRGATISGGGAGTELIMGNGVYGDPSTPGILANRVLGSFGSIGGGFQNTAGNATAADELADAYTTVSGGYGNAAVSQGSTVSGGEGNSAGNVNLGAQVKYATVAGGFGNSAGGSYSFVAGGRNNSADGEYSFAAGHRARSFWPGSFVWADNSQQVTFASTQPNQFIVRAAGGVGIGTDSPANSFHVFGSPNSPGGQDASGYVAQIENGQFSGFPGGLAVKMAGNDSTDTNFLAFFANSGANVVPVGAIERNGANGVSFRTTGADYAEYLPKANPNEVIVPGEVVGVKNGKVTRDTANAQVLLVASTGAAVSGNAPADEDEKNHVLTAMLGQVDVRVNGPVAAGDILIASPYSDGAAIAVAIDQLSSTDAMRVVGRAWTSHEGQGQGRVRALIGYGRADEILSTEMAALRSQHDEYKAELAKSAVELQTLREQVATLKQESAVIAGLVQQLQANDSARIGLVSRAGER